MKSSKILGVIVAASLSGLAGIEIPLSDCNCAIGIAQAAPVIGPGVSVVDPGVSVVMQPQNLPMKGNPNAIVTIIEFSDYQCPFCNRAEPTIKQLLEDYPDKIRVVFAHMPLPFHANAKSAAKAAHAAHLQGKFWEMHDILFANYNGLSEDLYIQKAGELGLDIERFKADMASQSTADYVEKCINDGSKEGLKGTPSFLINGVQFVGAQPIDNFKKVIDEEIIRAEKTAKEKKLSGEKLYAELVKSAPKPAPNPIDPDDDVPLNPNKRVYISDGSSAVIGNKTAPVTIVAFVDMQCPFSSRGWDTIEQLMKNNPKKIRVVVKHLPLSFHKNAELAARAVEAAKKQKKFQPYMKKLFANVSTLDRDNLIKYAKELKLNEKKFIADMDSAEAAGQVLLDKQSAEELQVKGTPHFFFNGISVSGAQPLEKFQRTLDVELKAAEPYTKKKLSGQKLYEKIVSDNPEPDIPEIVIDTTGAPVLGPDDAPITIVEFSDFECPFCNRANNTIHELMALPEYQGKIKLVFMHNPLEFHQHATSAAKAAIFAHENGKFWEMHDLLFENHSELGNDNLLQYAASIGLNAEELSAVLASDRYNDVIQANLKEGQKAGVSGTPSFIINGVMFRGAQPLVNFQQAVNDALKRAENKKQEKSKEKPGKTQKSDKKK